MARNDPQYRFVFPMLLSCGANSWCETNLKGLKEQRDFRRQLNEFNLQIGNPFCQILMSAILIAAVHEYITLALEDLFCSGIQIFFNLT